ncbi:hypothetical protein VOLCADRAFT_93574 [Volvox carteri f. nagariensis]|uniref:Protein kinase domain-containing protein n=1 Tax=Volvox carteri f. nagariensis TaxID=3068 RepID=D8U2H1_VOLCA|nr:uncharacterized protein VOLCADRAFT_93574 [Volvox carteri f. nagariensis]EFJ46063.1 hypothetical protein VOLCADRAFT_93574 [Volvox carteri f. nagariensis]|eukprot:XP_002952813.1 hypothetical protein VOLCADRAFT_93574 [Volvox carteri f. nagariensis]
MTTGSPMPSVQRGQPANPVSVPSHIVAKAGRQSGTPRAVPGPSYESEEEGEGRATVEERLNDITRSVKSHANAAGAGYVDEVARRHIEDAAKRLAAERGLAAASQDNAKAVVVAAATGDRGVLTAVTATAAAAEAANIPSCVAPADADAAAAAAAPPLMPLTTAAPLEAAGCGDSAAGEAATMYDVDLNIDLSKGELKVDYSTRGLLGQGGFAAVYKGRYKAQRVAVKMIKKTAGSTLADLQEDVRALIHELHILRQRTGLPVKLQIFDCDISCITSMVGRAETALFVVSWMWVGVDHPNIVKLYGGCLTPPHIFLVEERMEGTLDFYVHHVRKHDALSVREVLYFALDIASGLSYLHPSRDGRCKISDFGLARTKIKEYLSTKNLDAGTTAYIAPECFVSMDNPELHDLRRSVTDRTDVYALGIIMWEMLAGKRPWQGLKPLLVAYQVAYRSLRPPLFELGARCPLKLRQLIEECWCQEPKLRLSSQQAVDRLLEILNELPAGQVPVVGPLFVFVRPPGYTGGCYGGSGSGTGAAAAFANAAGLLSGPPLELWWEQTSAMQRAGRHPKEKRKCCEFAFFLIFACTRLTSTEIGNLKYLNSTCIHVGAIATGVCVPLHGKFAPETSRCPLSGGDMRRYEAI